MTWTPERIESLRSMWLSGASSSEIASALGGVSRNAVMGKVHRLGLMGSPDHNRTMRSRPQGCCRPKSFGPPLAAEESLIPVDPSPSDEQAEAPDVSASEALVPEHLLAPEDVLAPEEVSEQEAMASAPVLEEPKEESIVLETVPERVPETQPVAVEAEPIGVAFARRYAAARREREAIRRPAPRMSPVAEIGTVTISKGTMARTGAVSQSWQDVRSVLRDLTGIPFDRRVRGHLAAVVGIATVLAGGDPRVILCPHLQEPDVLRMMRDMAVNGMVVAGRPPERWLDPESGDSAFWEDMLSLEPVPVSRRHDARGIFA